MTEGIRYEVSDEFVRRVGLELDGTDLAYGFSRRLIKARDVIVIATREVSFGSRDPLLIRLSELLLQQADQVEGVLRKSTQPPGEETIEKWLYLQLRAARDLAAGDDTASENVLDQIYSDFDYPEVMAPLTGYTTEPVARVSSLAEAWDLVLERLRRRIGPERS